jgi:hypothetical protein
MTGVDLEIGILAATEVYPETKVLAATGSVYPLRVGPIPIPVEFWGGGNTTLLVVFDLANHESVRPRGLLGPEWRLPNGGAPFNASTVFEFGETWQAYSWNFPWPPALGVVETIEAYLGRFNDHR